MNIKTYTDKSPLPYTICIFMHIYQLFENNLNEAVSEKSANKHET